MNNLDDSRGLTMPRFSSGWVGKFRRRYRMRHRPLLDRHHVLATPDHLSDEKFRSRLPTGSSKTVEQASIIFSLRSNGATKSISANDSPGSNFRTSINLSSDHLIHLVQHNVFRALFSNMSLLRTAATFLKAPYPTAFSNESATQLCGGLTVVRPLIDQNIPGSLYPTPLQMNCVHTSRIDMFPFPKFGITSLREVWILCLKKCAVTSVGIYFRIMLHRSQAIMIVHTINAVVVPGGEPC